MRAGSPRPKGKPTQVSRFYTVAQANAQLPELTRLLKAMQVQGQQLAGLQGRVALRKQKIKSNGHHNPAEDAMVEQASRALEEALQNGIRQLAELNIELKDLERGLIDFPAMREGEEVFLCWELGEPEVNYWHETTTGYAGRKPLDDKIA